MEKQVKFYIFKEGVTTKGPVPIVSSDRNYPTANKIQRYLSLGYNVKTPEQLEDLKRHWKQDACWDIEETEGFEPFKEELYVFRIKTESDWVKQYEERRSIEMAAMGIDSINTYEYLKGLERRLEKIEQKLDIY